MQGSGQVADDLSVRLLHGAAVVAHHPRSWGHRQEIEHPEHRAEILRRKRGAPPSTGREPGEPVEYGHRHEMRLKFWTALQVYEQKVGGLHADQKPGHYHWQGKRQDGLWWNFVVRQGDTRAELYIDLPNQSRNKAIFVASTRSGFAPPLEPTLRITSGRRHRARRPARVQAADPRRADPLRSPERRATSARSVRSPRSWSGRASPERPSGKSRSSPSSSRRCAGARGR